MQENSNLHHEIQEMERVEVALQHQEQLMGTGLVEPLTTPNTNRN